MKSYLSLIPISAKVRKRQNRMTILCIVIAVFLVTAIFSVADMFMKAETIAMQEKHGSWHLSSSGITDDMKNELDSLPGLLTLGWSESFNTDAAFPYYVGEKKAALHGVDEAYGVKQTNMVEEGTFPKNNEEVLLSSNAKLALDVKIGDRVTLHTPAGDKEFSISGFGSDDKEYYQGQTFLVAVYMGRDAFHDLMSEKNISENLTCYLQFENADKAVKAKAILTEQYGIAIESIKENTAVMGLSGQSSNSSINGLYAIAIFLFVLVLLAGVLMISGSMNSNIAQRTQFFGMMRCVGASRDQIVRFVRLEALNWCKTAVPIGLVFGTVAACGISAFLHFGIGGEFATMPYITISPIGIAFGIAVGVITVLLAAQAPAKRAAKVSPVLAVSGNSESNSSAKHAIKHRINRVEYELGMHHATGSRKNWFLMTASFALSIILVLCFSVGLDFAQNLLPNMKSYQPDIDYTGYENALLLDQETLEQIHGVDGVENAFACSYISGVPVISANQEIDHINLLSYDAYLLECAEDRIVQGKISDIYGDSDKVMTISNKDNPLQVGDTINLGGNEVTITCAVSDGLFPSELLIICSQETFERLTGENNYSMIGVQLGRSADDETIYQLSKLADSDVIFSDLRESNQSNETTYMAVQAMVYGFLAIIGMITLFYTVNSISISVVSRITQYGAMRAVGMSGDQLTRMIATEGFTYAVSGMLVGLGIGIPVSRLLYVRLITRYFGSAWQVPWTAIIIIVVCALASAAIAIHAPAKRIRNMSITETINEL